jgi:hypothetical protein
MLHAKMGKKLVITAISHNLDPWVKKFAKTDTMWMKIWAMIVVVRKEQRTHINGT